ncbi:hypothetical protein DEO72_LG6g1526 [Vigna unguiculata]|uniref:Uncharacterized protein n=1 Tax=Vigna unguiculata TaxID=3917 RepID=A0A4D6M9N4_VIGUN|nr:hypothetical protein DEO72_LG6g1526 [Vigna unguiculata]
MEVQELKNGGVHEEKKGGTAPAPPDSPVTTPTTVASPAGDDVVIRFASRVAPTTSASFLDHRGQGRHRSVAVVNWNTIGDSSSALSFLTLTWLNPSTSSRTTRIKATKLRLAGGNAAGDDFISLTVLCFRLDACD